MPVGYGPEQENLNGQYDRITNMLRQRAQPIGFNDLAASSMQDIGNALGGQGVHIADTLRGYEDRSAQAEMDIAKVFEAQVASGDAQAKALNEKISLFTGGDPQGTAMMLQALHDDPEEIDPTNSYQVMSKLAGIAKRSGYVSPQLDYEDKKRKLDIQETQAKINKMNQPDIPSSYQEYLLSQQNPGYADFVKETTPKTNINVGGQETEAAKAIGKGAGDKFVGIQDEAMTALGSNANLDALKNEISSGVQTGGGEQTLLKLRRAAKTAGFDVGDLSGQEAVQAIGNQLALQVRNPSGGAGMPGSLSNADRDFLVNSSPGLAQTPTGNLKLIDIKQRLNKRSVEVASMAREYAKQNGGFDYGFFDILQQYSEQNPLFSDMYGSTGGNSGKQIRIINNSGEEFDIDENDLPDAMKDGFKVK